MSPLLFEPFLLTGRMEATSWSPCPSPSTVTLDMLQVTSSSTTSADTEKQKVLIVQGLDKLWQRLCKIPNPNPWQGPNVPRYQIGIGASVLHSSVSPAFSPNTGTLGLGIAGSDASPDGSCSSSPGTVPVLQLQLCSCSRNLPPVAGSQKLPALPTLTATLRYLFDRGLMLSHRPCFGDCSCRSSTQVPSISPQPP